MKFEPPCFGHVEPPGHAGRGLYRLGKSLRNCQADYLVAGLSSSVTSPVGLLVMTDLTTGMLTDALQILTSAVLHLASKILAFETHFDDELVTIQQELSASRELLEEIRYH